MRLGRLALLAVATTLLMVPGSAGAAVTFGSNLASPPTAKLCSLPGVTSSCTQAIGGLPLSSRAPGGATAPIDGVIVGWSVRTGSSSITHKVRLRVVRGYTGAGGGAIEVLPKTEGVYSFAARVPVKEKDQVALDTLEVPEGLGVPVIRILSSAVLFAWNPPLGEAENRPPSATSAEVELLINATIEPDADGDGFGDETQDQCPADSTTQGACPSSGGGGGSTGGGATGTVSGTSPTAQPVVAPETILGKRPAGTIHSRRVTFRFNANIAGSSFQCKLDRKPFKACRSPKTYKGLAEGKHTFKVRAIGPTGLVDQTPGKRNFKVEL
jgi:hypothetical protein